MGGWLLVLAVAVVLAPLQLLIGGLGLLGRLLSPEGGAALRTAWEHSLPMGAALLVSTFGSLAIAAWGGFAAVMFFKRSRRFPSTYFAMSGAAFAMALLVLALGMSSEEFRTRPDTPRLLARGVVGAIFSAGWMIYVRTSVRVANTFVHD